MGSLFNQTVAKASKCESDLEEATKRIASLEVALKNSRAVNAQLLRKLYGASANSSWLAPQDERKNSAEINSLSSAEVDQLFKQNAIERVELTPTLGTKFKKMVAALLTRSEGR